MWDLDDLDECGYGDNLREHQRNESFEQVERGADDLGADLLLLSPQLRPADM